MELDHKEFGTLTEKLESYASQVSKLQTTIQMQNEIKEVQAENERERLENMRLKFELETVKAQLEQQEQMNEDITQERDFFKNKAEELEASITKTSVEIAYLKNYVMLSLASIKTFAQLVKRIDLKSMLYTFVSKTLAPEMGARGIQALNEAIDLTDVPDGLTLNNPTFQGPMYEVHDNDDVKL